MPKALTNNHGIYDFYIMLKNNKILIEFVLSRENCCKCIESDQLLYPIIIIEMSIPI